MVNIKGEFILDKQAKNLSTLGTGLFFIGLAVLFFVRSIPFWPWILVVIALAWLPVSLATKKGWYGWNSFVWLVGIALLFHFNVFWPGILILIGISMAFSALTKNSSGSPFMKDEQEKKDPTQFPPN